MECSWAGGNSHVGAVMGEWAHACADGAGL